MDKMDSVAFLQKHTTKCKEGIHKKCKPKYKYVKERFI